MDDFPTHSSQFPQYTPCINDSAFSESPVPCPLVFDAASLFSHSQMFQPALFDSIGGGCSAEEWEWESYLVDAKTSERILPSPELRPLTNAETRRFSLIEAALTRDNRGHIVLNLYETEANYVKDLKLLVSDYKIPVLAAHIIKEAAARLIFSKTDELLHLHTVFLGKLEEVIDPTVWSSETSCIGRVFLDYTSEFTALYQKFIESYSLSRKALIAECKVNPLFLEFLDRTYKTVKRELSEFLVLPVQRTTRYHLLLKDLVKNTPETHIDYLNLVASWELMTTLAEKINTAKRNADESMGLFEAYEMTRNCPPTIINASRRMVFQCDVIDAFAANKKMHFFLCSDVLLVALPIEVGLFKKKEERVKYKFYKLHELLDLSLEDVGEAAIKLQYTKRDGQGSPSKITESLHTVQNASLETLLTKKEKELLSTKKEGSFTLRSPFHSFGSSSNLLGKKESSSTTFSQQGLATKESRPSIEEADRDRVVTSYGIKFEGYDAKKIKIGFVNAFLNERKKCLGLT